MSTMRMKMAQRMTKNLRFGHTLVVPYYHSALTKYSKDGLVPLDQVRELNEFELKPWEFWTSSPAFHITTPKTRGIVQVPIGEAWVVERFGSYSRTLESGTSFIAPFVESVKAVKNTTLNSMGFICNDVTTKSGSVVDAYGVAIFRVSDAKTSTYYVDAETNKTDSERAASRLLRKSLSKLIAQVETNGPLSSSVKKSLAQSVLDEIKAAQDGLGLVFESVEIRGAFGVAENVPVKIRACEAPMVDLSGPGHDLAADYWADVLTPPYFQKFKHGSEKTPVTPMTPSMEWNVPSPPDFHHFNMQPRVTVAPEEEELKKLGGAAH